MKKLIFKKEKKSIKIAVLITVGFLFFLFVLGEKAQAANPGDHCYVSEDCGAEMDCYYNTCLKKAFSSCNTSFDCAGNATHLMGCFNGVCLGRNAYPCGDYRDDPVCAPGFHCDISNPGYHYCEADDESDEGSPRLTISKSVNKTYVSPGEEILYTITYANTGNAPAHQVIIKDPFNNLNQEYLTFLSANPSPTSGTDTWEIGTLNPNASGQITIRARVSNWLPSGNLEIRNKATIDSEETPLQYSNYVSTFVNNNSASLVIDKLVRNINLGTGFSETTEANPGDELEFSLTIRSTGNSPAFNVRVWDNLPDRLSYIPNSTKVDGFYKEDGITTGGIYLGDLAPSQTKTVSFRARVAEASAFSSGITFLTNYGYASAEGVGLAFDQAGIKVNKSSSICSALLQVNKQARNITQGSSYWAETVSARPGDEIEFLIRVDSFGSETATNAWIKDVLPAKLNYLLGTTLVNGVYKEDGITNNGIYLGNLYVGDFREIRFKAKVAESSEFALGSTTLVNYAYSWADKTCGSVSDSLQIIVNKEGYPTYPLRSLSVNKMGRNISRGQANYLDSFLAGPNEEVEFLIQITNIGNTDLNNLRITESLPSKISIIPGSITLDDVSWSGEIRGVVLNLGILRPSQTKTIKFRGRIASPEEFDFGSTTLVNTVYVTADNLSQMSDQASVIVYKSGEVLGAAYVKTGADLISLLLLAVISFIITFFVYCRLREKRFLRVVSNNKESQVYKWLIKLYFKLRSFLLLRTLRFRKKYLLVD